MKKGLSVLILIILIVFLLIAAVSLYDNLSDKVSSEQLSSESEEDSNAAPNFTVTDINGNDVSLSDFYGKPIILNFWASWCSPCKSEMPDFDAVYTLYGEDIQFMMVNLTDGTRETVEKGTEYIENQGYSFPIFFDEYYEASVAYGVTSIPATYLIDKNGDVIGHARGAIDMETLLTGVDMLLAE